MSNEAGAKWRELAPEISREELAVWTPRIATPVAVTGATGFVGSHLVDALLDAGMRPRVLVRDPTRLGERARVAAEVVAGDLDDHDALRRLVGGSGVVAHVAGVVRAPNASLFDHSNRVGTENLVAAMRDEARDSRLILVSSLSAAGPSADPAGIGPDEPARPISAYGRSKLGAEHAVRGFPGRWVILRPPAIFGPRDIDVLQFFRFASRGLVPIPAGERWVTVAFVADVIRGILAAAGGTADHRVLHVGEPTPHLFAGLIRAIAAAGGVRARTLPLPAFLVRLAGWGGDALQRLGFRSIAMTSDKARELLARHWTSRTGDSLEVLGLSGYVPFGVGAAATWQWYREHGILPRVKMRRL